MALQINSKYKAKAVSYNSATTRKLSAIQYIVIHYTAGKGDTAKNEAMYFANGNTRQAGAHYFVDKKGKVYKSININRAAWAVGGDMRSGDGGGKIYGKCTNSNSISIELCDCLSDVNYTQLLAMRQLVLKLQAKCKNAKHIVRRWDVNGKHCPAPVIGKDNAKWKRVSKFLAGTLTFTAKVTSTAAIRTGASVKSAKIGTLTTGKKVKVLSEKCNWAKIQLENGKTGYVTLSKLTFA